MQQLKSQVVLIFCLLSLFSTTWAEESQHAITGAPSIRVASYNVKNYVLMPRRIGGHMMPNAGKLLTEKEAVVRMIGWIHPDILGLMEIGDPTQLEDLKQRLAESGYNYPYSEYLQGSDTIRHVALLSRFPILERHSQENLPLCVKGVILHSPRGLLDVTLEPVKGYRLRILCVHLKAKIEVASYKSEELREAESRAIRRTVRDIFRNDPNTRLILMGDFNDSKNEKPIWQIEGKPNWPDSLHALPLVDDRGEFWTEYWSWSDIYSRIDYMMISKNLNQDIDLQHSGIARLSFWEKASDHCPLYLTLVPFFSHVDHP